MQAHAPPVRSRLSRIPADVTRLLYVRNLPFKIRSEDLYELFGKYGGVHNVWVGNTQETKGTAYVMYNDIMDAKAATDQLNNMKMGQGRFLVVLYYNKERMDKATEQKTRRRDVEEIQKSTFL